MAPRAAGQYDEPATMSKTDPLPDVLVIGEHPAAYLAAALVAHKSKVAITHVALPVGHAERDRLVLINPSLFELHPILEAARKQLDLRGIYGLQFLADDPPVRSEHRAKSAVAGVCAYAAV